MFSAANVMYMYTLYSQCITEEINQWKESVMRITQINHQSVRQSITKSVNQWNQWSQSNKSARKPFRQLVKKSVNKLPSVEKQTKVNWWTGVPLALCDFLQVICCPFGIKSIGHVEVCTVSCCHGFQENAVPVPYLGLMVWCELAKVGLDRPINDYLWDRSAYSQNMPHHQ